MVQSSNSLKWHGGQRLSSHQLCFHNCILPRRRNKKNREGVNWYAASSPWRTRGVMVDAARPSRVPLYVWGTHRMVSWQIASLGLTLESLPETAISWRATWPKFLAFVRSNLYPLTGHRRVQLKRLLILNLSIVLWDSITELRFMEVPSFLQRICIKHKPRIWTIPGIHQRTKHTTILVFMGFTF